jgi:hypothetical protein
MLSGFGIIIANRILCGLRSDNWRIALMVNFCTHCGQRLQAPARFCDSCGAPLPGEPGREARRPALNRQSPEVGGMRQSSSEPHQEGLAAGEEAPPHGLDEFTLNLLLGASFAYAPLDTQFLFVANEEKIWVNWVPISLIDDMKGLGVLGCASVKYYVQGVEFTYVENSRRREVVSDVAAAFAEQEKKELISIDVFLQFQPPDYGPITQSIRGQWKGCIDNQGRKDVRLISSFPFTGTMMKYRLEAHELLVGLVGAITDDPQEKEALERVITSVQQAEKQMPKGPADHILCVAVTRLNGQDLPTVLTTGLGLDAAGDGGTPSQAPQVASRGLRGARIRTAGGRPPRIPAAVSSWAAIDSRYAVRFGSKRAGATRR